ncbi:MAG TPA: hypothetical protein VG755_15815 [Nannocystaceae bacterium]|nr:hypothetical protein [Nannocystaceae bacterium]
MRVIADELVARGGGVELRSVTLAIDVDAPAVSMAVLVDGTLAAESVGRGLLRVRYRVATSS